MSTPCDPLEDEQFIKRAGTMPLDFPLREARDEKILASLMPAAPMSGRMNSRPLQKRPGPYGKGPHEWPNYYN